MDPNTCLKDILDLAAIVLDGDGHLENHQEYRLAELVVALSEWMAGGGFVPDVWDCSGIAEEHNPNDR